MRPKYDREPPAPVVPPESVAAVAGTVGESVGESPRDLDRQAGVVTAASAVVSRHDHDGGASAALPAVLADVPVAVLLIDQNAGTVTYANVAAVQLAGNVRLPVDVDTWGAAAGLTDLSGRPLARTSGPLSLIARGEPVTGEAVRLSPTAGGEGERAEGAVDRAAEQLLWVTGFPLSQIGNEQQLALVVFLRVDTAREGNPDGSLQALRERAVIATDITFTITDPRRADNPLIWVNPSFTRVTGYEHDEAVGRNCRFLQGPATDPEELHRIREALREQRTVTTTLLNYRKDGTAFWNQLSIDPVFDGRGELVSYVGVQIDVTERVRGDAAREAALAAEKAARQEAEQAREAAEQARAVAERAQARLGLMAEATSTFIATLDPGELLDRLAGLTVPLLADWVVVTLVDPQGVPTRTAFRHREGREAELARFSALHAMHLPAASPTRRSLETGRSILVPPSSLAGDERLVASPRATELLRTLGSSSALSIPMVARRRTLGALTLVMASADRRFEPPDIELAEDLARRAALAVDNVRLYQQEHAVADTLQRSLLPELPEIPGIEAAARYVSASTAADVGGDFYDLLRLPDGSIGLAIGDVVGHDVAAAAAMGHLRGLIRACVWDAADPDPAPVLTRVDRLVQGLRIRSMATLAYLRAVPPDGEGGPWRLQVGNAGHPPLLLRRPDGEVRLLDGIGGLLVGVDASTHRTTLTLDAPAGSTIVGYTDGLIERPGEDLDGQIAALAARLARTPAEAGPEALCDAAIATRLDGRDDVALIAVRLGSAR